MSFARDLEVARGWKMPLGADPVTHLLGLVECRGKRRRWDRDVTWFRLDDKRRADTWSTAYGARAYPPGLGPVATPLDITPAINTQRRRNFEEVRFTLADATAAGLWTELVRTVVLSPGVTILRRVVTFLKVQFLDQGGGVVGEFRTVTDTDPSLARIDHPQVGIDPLLFAWRLVADRPPSDLTDPLLVGAESLMPRQSALEGVPIVWTDLRYSWGSRYSERHDIVAPQSTRIRLFIRLSTADPSAYRITAGGLLGGIFLINAPASLRTAEDG